MSYVIDTFYAAMGGLYGIYDFFSNAIERLLSSDKKPWPTLEESIKLLFKALLRPFKWLFHRPHGKHSLTYQQTVERGYALAQAGALSQEMNTAAAPASAPVAATTKEAPATRKTPTSEATI